MDAVVAVYSDWGIGAEGTQPLVIPADRVRFRELTTGHAVIVGLTEPGILVGQGLRARPEIPLERFLREIARTLEHDRETLEQVGLRAVLRHEGEQRRVDPHVVPTRGDVPGHHDPHPPAGQGRLGAHAGEGRIPDEVAEGLGTGVLSVVAGEMHAGPARSLCGRPRREAAAVRDSGNTTGRPLFRPATGRPGDKVNPAERG